MRKTSVCFRSIALFAFIHALSSPLSAEVVFRDDFNGPTLSPEWEVIGEDPDRMTMDGEIFLFLTTTERRGLCYQGELPKDYTVRLKASVPNQDYVEVGLFLIESEKKWLNVTVKANASNGVSEINFAKSLKGKVSKHTKSIYDDVKLLHVLLNITKNGIEYKGNYRLNDKAGQVGHEQVILNLKVNSVCIEAKNTRTDVPEIPVRFDYFEISK